MYAVAALADVPITKDCFGQICQPIEEYCYALTENCQKCSSICLETSHNYKKIDCLRDCTDYVVLQHKEDIYAIQQKQNIFYILLILLSILVGFCYIYEFLKWLKHRSYMKNALHKLRRFKRKATQKDKNASNGNGIGGTTIQNICAISDTVRAPSQIYSVNGVEGSVLTMTTPISARYPAEDTTPTSTQQTTEYSYVNEALAVTPTTPAVV